MAKSSPEAPADPMAISEPTPIARWEWAVLGILLAGCATYWILHFHKFSIPGPDFYQYEQTGKELTALHLPSTYKRMPLFPVLMNLAGRLVRTEEPFMDAALALSMAFSLGLLAILFYLGRRLIGPAAIFPVVMLASITVFNNMALQPLLEPCMAFFIFLTFLLFHLRSRWQYAAAFCAAIARPEGCAVIPIIFVLNMVYEEDPFKRRLLKHVVFAGLASTGFLTWMVLSKIYSAGAGNPYLDQMQQQGWHIEWKAALRTISVPFGQWVRNPKSKTFWVCIVMVPLLTSVGLVTSFLKFRREALALLAFVVLYVGAHMSFGVDLARYSSWRRLAAKRNSWLPFPLVFVCALVGLYCSYSFVRKIAGDPGVRGVVVYAGFYFFLLGALLVYWLLEFRKPLIMGVLAGMGMIALASPFVGQGVLGHAKGTWRALYGKYTCYKAGQWLKHNLRPGQKAVVVTVTAIARAGPISKAQLIGFGHLKARNLEEFTREVEERGVSYVIYTYRRNRGDARDTYYHNLFKAYLMEPFKDGKDVAGFEHLETIPMPDRVRKPPVQVYRFTGSRTTPATKESPRS